MMVLRVISVIIVAAAAATVLVAGAVMLGDWQGSRRNRE
jgi:hypothetical protein